MGKYKLKLAAIALVAIVMTFFAQETLAYYTTVGTATNVVTSGNIQFTSTRLPRVVIPSPRKASTSHPDRSSPRRYGWKTAVRIRFICA